MLLKGDDCKRDNRRSKAILSYKYVNSSNSSKKEFNILPLVCLCLRCYLIKKPVT